MRNKYKSVGLDYDLINSKYPDINEYEKIVNFYLEDEFFEGIGKYLENEDYALAKDATKGLFILAQDLYLYPLYIALVDIYEDLDSELYNDVNNHYKDMKEVYEKIRGIFHV
jgi:hypothetical protein